MISTLKYTFVIKEEKKTQTDGEQITLKQSIEIKSTQEKLLDFLTALW